MAELTGGRSIPLSQYIEEYCSWAGSVQNRRTYQMNRLALRKLQSIAGKSIRLDRINHRHIDELIAEGCRQGLKPATINNNIRHARTALNKAIEWGYLAVNPLAGVKQLPQDEPEIRFLPLEDMGRFLGQFETTEKRCLALAYLATGRRASEILRLQWQDINIEARRYFLTRSKRRRGEWFPVSSLFRLALEALGPKDIGPVFRWRSRNSAYKIIKAGLVAAGHPGLTLHDLRHTFASWQVMQGRDLRTVQKLLGHTNYRTTEKYAHLSTDHLQAAAELNVGPIDLG